MKSKYSLSDVVVSLNTPFDWSGKIDFESMARSVEMHLCEGASGFLAPAHAGEVTALTRDERIEIIRFLRQCIGTRAEFIACATAATKEESFAIVEAALKADCQSVLVEIPKQYRSDRKAAIQFCRSIAQIGVPMLAVQDLDWDGFGLPVEWILELFEVVDSFQCLKVEVRPAGPKYTQVIEATNGQLTVAGGWAADQMIEALDRGVDIFMPTAMTRMYSLIVGNHRANNREDAVRAFHAILPVLAFTRQHLDISIQFYKQLFVRRGIFSTPAIRKSCLPYDSYHQRYGEELIGYLGRVEATILNRHIATTDLTR